jgi:hypothetical protein
MRSLLLRILNAPRYYHTTPYERYSNYRPSKRTNDDVNTQVYVLEAMWKFIRIHKLYSQMKLERTAIQQIYFPLITQST